MLLSLVSRLVATRAPCRVAGQAAVGLTPRRRRGALSCHRQPAASPQPHAPSSQGRRVASLSAAVSVLWEVASPVPRRHGAMLRCRGCPATRLAPCRRKVRHTARRADWLRPTSVPKKAGLHRPVSISRPMSVSKEAGLHWLVTMPRPTSLAPLVPLVPLVPSVLRWHGQAVVAARTRAASYVAVSRSDNHHRNVDLLAHHDMAWPVW